MNLEIFAIAPEIPDFEPLVEVDDELNFISDRFVIYPQPPLVGIVNAADIEHEVQRHQADVLFIASHNDENGIVVSDGRVTEDEISAWVKQLGASLLILSVCSGAKIAKRVNRSTGCYVLFCRIDVPDREAMLYSARFMAALERCDSYDEAFAFAGDARGRYVLLRGKDLTGSGAITRLAEQLDALGREVTNLRIEVVKLSQELNNIKEKNAILPEPAIDPRWLWLFLSLMVLIAGGIVVGLIR